MVVKVSAVLRRYRPLFVACEDMKATPAKRRGRLFADAVAKACEREGVLLLPVSRAEVRLLAPTTPATRHRVAVAMAEAFPELRSRLPPKRQSWRGEAPRIGVFLALAAAVATWDAFRRGQR
jgi:hypothetical protein